MNINMLARQPIYNQNNQLFAFELLYRGDDSQNAGVTDDFKATSELLANLCMNSLDEEISANRPIFINVDLEFLTSESFFSTPPPNLVFEILETVEISERSINCIRKLKQRGFTFALDDFELAGQHSKLFPYISYLKIDVQAESLDDIEHYLKNLNGHNFSLLAEKVEDKESFDRCLQMGFELFQGYYLERPKVITGNKVTANKQVALQLISELSREDISNDEIAELIATDPRLTFKLLKIINCPLYPFKREIENIHEAVVMLGVDIIKQWAKILTLVSESEQPVELFRTLLVRAKTCELYGKSVKVANAKDCFTIGLFSGLDAALNLKLDNILKEIRLASHIKTALQDNNYSEQNVLLLVKDYEKNLALKPALPQQKQQALTQHYWQAVKWTDEIMTLIT
ncbi:HDOD domain-containing protein [Thalassomonas viridans]|uniref:HDOD domain-containing protein n=1 Tax=Thalassomonas viridans TaxID=137584 RepID=A0AAE9Z997_9GAMM|nr:HDOD domain-containing protein [Thalassomonas viridans]WDE07442.1 HDOD domain-containing protein [Thalassomonas viridans]